MSISVRFVLILKKQRSFCGSISLTILLALPVSCPRLPAYDRVVELSSEVLTDEPKKKESSSFSSNCYGPIVNKIVAFEGNIRHIVVKDHTSIQDSVANGIAVLVFVWL